MKARILTAVLLLPFAIGAVWYLPNTAFALLLIAMFGIGAWEWGRMMQLTAPAQTAYLLLLWVLCAAAWWITSDVQMLRLLIALGAVWWLAATLWVLVYPAGLPAGTPRRLLKAVVGLLILVPAFAAIGHLQGLGEMGPARVLVLFCLIWGADTGAYFAGRSFGKTKLAPAVSPGKTWEGVAGGLTASLIVAAVAGSLLFKFHGAQLALFLALAVFTVAISIVGDLTESMFKRHVGLKDSGRLFPGHGGMLDRTDSMLAAAPCHLLGLMLLGL
ncbi:MAG: phosphatidate cytidylyltransferase [Nevskiales bacterium]